MRCYSSIILPNRCLVPLSYTTTIGRATLRDEMVTSLIRTPKELLKSPSFLLKRLGAIAKDKTVEEFERAGATAYSYAVLAVLEEGTRETQATIADALC